MGALQLQPMRAGTIRRVIRRGDQYICGLCRSTYDNESHAQSCIQGCWTELLALDPVIVKRRLVGVAYRCRFCARDYAKRPDAATCAVDCKAHHLALHEAEQSLTDQSDEPSPKKRLLKSVSSGGKAKSAKRKKAKASKAAKPAPLPAPINADAIPGGDIEIQIEEEDPMAGATPHVSISLDSAGAAGSAATGSGSGSATSSGAGSGSGETEMLHGIGTGAYGKKKDEGPSKTFESGPNKLKTSDAFFRDGAKYVCNGCQTKYFTRGEVEACFEKH